MDHVANFLEFSRLHLLSGCPDPHLKIAVHQMVQEDDPYESAWRAGCYVAPYEVCTGSLIWSNWNVWDARNKPEQFTKWIADTWPKWNIRRERRAARTPTKMAECLLSYANFVTTPELLAAHARDKYDDFWKLADANLRYFGRYALIKLLHALHTGGIIEHPINDIRPAGGWSPRETMALLDPAMEELYTKNSTKPDVLAVIKTRTDIVKELLEDHVGEKVSYYDVEVLLCNYRQYPKHHPGWPLDSDLNYYHTFVQNWEEPVFDWKAVRAELFPAEVLGEIQGWEGPREELNEVFPKHGYLWSDVLYDYQASKANLASPVER